MYDGSILMIKRGWIVGKGFDREDIEEVIEDFGVPIMINGEGLGHTCVICGGDKEYLEPFYCEECKIGGNYEV